MFEKLDGDFVVLDDTILFYKGSATKVVVPSSIDGNPIRRIGDGAFCENANIKSIEISEGIEEIGLFSMAMMPMNFRNGYMSIKSIRRRRRRPGLKGVFIRNSPLQKRVS